jgi:hypothetical protein
VIVKPAPGVKVRDPVSRQHIPEAGYQVSDTDTYWRRRLMAGDVIEVEPCEAAPVNQKKE